MRLLSLHSCSIIPWFNGSHQFRTSTQQRLYERSGHSRVRSEVQGTFFFLVYFLRSEISSPTCRKQETNKTFIWKATGVFQKKQLIETWVSPGIILAGYLFSEKKNVFTCNITIRVVRIGRILWCYSFRIVHWCTLLKKQFHKRNFNKYIIQVRFFHLHFMQSVYVLEVFSSKLCTEHPQPFLIVTGSCLRVKLPSLDDFLVQISYIIANFPLRFLSSKHRVCVKAVVLRCHWARSAILAQRPPSLSNPGLEEHRRRENWPRVGNHPAAAFLGVVVVADALCREPFHSVIG